NTLESGVQLRNGDKISTHEFSFERGTTPQRQTLRIPTLIPSHSLLKGKYTTDSVHLELMILGVGMLDVHKLALLREVGLHGSVTAAAKSLRMSTSNAAQRLSRLEQETGVKLLETLGRGVILTDAAWRLVAQTEDILAALEQAEADLSASRDALAGRVRLVGFHSFALRMLAEVAAHLRELAPA